MADLDDLREGADFGLGINCENQSFHVKGAENLPWGMKDRLSRIFNPKTGKAVMLAFDHGFIMGPTSGLERIDLNIVPLIEYADCLMCTRGILQSTIPANTTKPICLRSDAGTSILTDLNDNVLIDIEDAIRMNVSAMAVMLAIGDEAHEAKTVANLYKAVDKASRYNIPVMGVTAVGKQMARDARYFGLASRICAENGANIVKTYYCEGFELSLIHISEPTRQAEISYAVFCLKKKTHKTRHDLVCRLLLEKKKSNIIKKKNNKEHMSKR